MAINDARTVIKQFTLDAVNWTAITAPIDCNGYLLSDSARATTLYRRTTDTDSTTQDSVLGGSKEGIEGGQPLTIGQTPRFAKNSAVCYARSASGTITAVAEFF